MKMLSPPWLTPADAASALAEASVPVEIRLPAESSELGRARDFVTEAGREFGLERKACFELVFAVNEALTNAIRHGSPASDGTVGLRIEFQRDELVCLVSDCGPFIPPRTKSDPTSDEGGRGFAFMSALTDEFELSVEPGNTVVELRKRRVEALVANA